MPVIWHIKEIVNSVKKGERKMKIDEYIENHKKVICRRVETVHPHVTEEYDVYGMELYEIKEMINKLKNGELEL